MTAGDVLFLLSLSLSLSLFCLLPPLSLFRSLSLLSLFPSSPSWSLGPLSIKATKTQRKKTLADSVTLADSSDPSISGGTSRYAYT